MIVIDSHLDLALNAFDFNRDLTRTVGEIRKSEEGITRNGRQKAASVAFPEMREGQVALCLATTISRVAVPGASLPAYSSSEIAYGASKGHLAYYRMLEAKGILRQITNTVELNAHMAEWEGPSASNAPLGYVFAFEGADAIVSPDQLEEWWDEGLRVIGMTHYGVGRYAHGHDTTGGLTDLGRALLREMATLGVILDVTHLSDDSFWEALGVFQGPVLASHSNCRALAPIDRNFSDDQLKALIARNAVIGLVPNGWLLYPGWVKGETSREVVGLGALVDHIDHICQLAGDVQHVGLGTDLGMYGIDENPTDLDTIADVQKIPGLMQARGYTEQEVRAFMYGNWLSFLGGSLPLRSIHEYSTR